MKRHELVIAGGGLAAARAIKSYRENGGDGRIVLVGAEATLPYHRPALSKKYLRGETTATPHVEDEAFYRDHDVDVRLGSRVTGVDAAARAVTLDHGSRLGYSNLLVATGAAPRRLAVPGVERDGVFTLRTIADSSAIHDAASAGRPAVVVGGGFIGLEAAASLRQLGLGVTLIHRASGLFDQLGSPEVGEQLAELYDAQGVHVLLGEEVASFGGGDALTHVETTSGLRIPADVAVVGVGVVPNVDFLVGSGVKVDGGVVVSARFETSAPGVYAAGDVANVFDPLYRRHRRMEHWSSANYQGTEVGRILAGVEGGYDSVSSFFSEVFGTTIKVFGDVGRFDAVKAAGSLADGLVATYSDEGRLVGALTIGQSDELETLVKQLIGERAPANALERGLIAA